MILYIIVTNYHRLVINQLYNYILQKDIESSGIITLYYILYCTRNSIKFSYVNPIQSFFFDLTLSLKL